MLPTIIKPHQGMKFKLGFVMLDLGKQAELAAAVTKMPQRAKQYRMHYGQKYKMHNKLTEGLAPLIGAVGKAEGKVLAGSVVP